MAKYGISYDFNEIDVLNFWKDKIEWNRTNVNLSDAKECCWHCGCKSKLQFCHIKPHSLGGEAVPSNIVLLCETCHRENPNIDDVEIMLNWIYQAKNVNLFGVQGHYWIFRGMEECVRLYSFDVFEYILRNRTQIDLDRLKTLITIYMNKACIHWSQAHFNPVTLGSIFYKAFKDYQSQNIKKQKLSDVSILNIKNKEHVQINDCIHDVLIPLLSYVAEQEKYFIKQRQAEGIKIAKEKGKHIGRPCIQYPKNWLEVYMIWSAGSITAREAMRRLDLKSTSFYKLVKLYKNEGISIKKLKKNFIGVERSEDYLKLSTEKLNLYKT